MIPCLTDDDLIWSRCLISPAPCLEGVAGPLVEVALHDDPRGRVGAVVHDGVVVSYVLMMSAHTREDPGDVLPWKPGT